MWHRAKSLFFIIRATAGTLLYQASTLVFKNFTWNGLQRCQSHKLLLFHLQPSIIYKIFFKKTFRGHHSMVTHVFNNFQVPKILGKKIMKKNLILHFFEMSRFETEQINISLGMKRKNKNIKCTCFLNVNIPLNLHSYEENQSFILELSKKMYLQFLFKS